MEPNPNAYILFCGDYISTSYATHVNPIWSFEDEGSNLANTSVA